MRDDFDAIPDPVGRRDTAGSMLTRTCHDIGLAAVADALKMLTVEFDPELKESLKRGEFYLLPAEGSPMTESSISAAIVAAKATVARVLCLTYRRFKLFWKASVSGLSKARTTVRWLGVSHRFNNGDDTERYALVTQDLEQALRASLQETIERSEPQDGLALIEKQNDGDPYGISYGELLASIVKSIQGQQEEIARVRQQNADLGHAVEALQEQVASFRVENEALRHSLEVLSEQVSEVLRSTGGRSSD